jgi:zinc-ribbon family
MIFIIGTRFFVWGSERTNEAMHCDNCGTIAPFLIKKGMTFITLFFVIPVIPISGMKHLLQCPNCKTRYQSATM